MKNLMSMALNDALERLDVASQNSYQISNGIDSLGHKYQEDIRTISSLISLANSPKNESANKSEMLEALQKLMESKQKDSSELRKIKDYLDSSKNEIPKAKNWIKAALEEQ